VARRGLETYRPLLILAVFLAAWWILPAAFKSFLRVSFKEFQAPVWIASSYLDDLEGFFARQAHSKVELRKAGREIARRKAFYQLQAQRSKTLQAEVERLETILELPGRRAFRHEVARVVRRDVSAWWQRITLRKGRDFGIPEGAAVVFAGGVVGRVTEVGAFTCEVELVTSPAFRMAAAFQEDSRPVVYQGTLQTGFGPPRGEVRDAPQDLVATARQPLRLVSTALGGAFPPGLNIGRVSWLEPGSSGIFQVGEVRLDERLLSLHEVTILIPFNPLEAGDAP
jgi:rod shape-determining protein MreC